MLSLKADNRSLTKSSRYSYLSTNYGAAVTSLVLVNSDGFTANGYVLLGEWGAERSEIVHISTVTSSTHTINLVSASKFAHPESTKATVVNYNQVKFYRTTTTTFSEAGTLLTTVDIQPDSYYTIYQDTTNSTGYGWFKFFNEHDGVATTNSNAIPYAGFDDNSVKKILDSFFSMLNNKEQKVITTDEAFFWLNEGVSIVQNALNIINSEYTVADAYSQSVTSGTAEYDWPSYFSTIVAVYDSNGIAIPHIAIKDVANNNNDAGNKVHYYLKGRKIGWSPTPTAAATYSLYHKVLPTKLTSLYDYVYMPNNNFYLLIEFLLYKACLKLSRSDAANHYKLFSDGLDVMRVTSVKQNDEAETFGIDDGANN